MAKQHDLNELESIWDDLLAKMEQTKQEIFTISEQSRRDYENLKNQLEDIRLTANRIIDQSEGLEDRMRAARRRLAEVTNSFSLFSEDEVREAYEQANRLQQKLSANRLEEKASRKKREELQSRLQNLLHTIERAEHFVNQVNVASNFFSTDADRLDDSIGKVNRNQGYSLQIIAAQEEERKHLSREIHDGPAQMMANVLLRSDLIERTYRQKGPELAFQEIKSLKESVREALTEVRRIIYDLRPMALDDLGLVPTLVKYLDTIEEYNPGTDITFVSSGQEFRLPNAYETTIFRLVQESVTNALRHGKAKKIEVIIEWQEASVIITVEDDGAGFDKSMVKDQSFGLRGMQERIDLVSGLFELTSSPGNGTTLKFTIPCNKDS